MTDAVLGAGSALKLGDGASPEGFETIAEILRMGPIGFTVPEVDVTNLDSTAKEYIGGLPDGNQVEFEMNWVANNTEQEALRSAKGATKNFRVEWADETQADFAMVVLDFQMGETTPETQLTARVSGRITGDITWS